MPVRDPVDRLLIGQAESVSNRAGKLFGDIMRHTLKSQAINGFAAGPVHDVTAVMYLVHPEFFTTKKMYAAIDLSKGLSYGRTVCDINNRYKKKPNVNVGFDTDLEAFRNETERVLRLYED